MRVPREDFKYRCDKCDYTSQFPSSFRQHKAQNHHGITAKGNRGPWICDVCGFEANGGKANGRQEVVTHILEKHPEVRTDKCKLCNYVTIGIYTLKVHMKIHQEDAMVKCDQCDFESTSKTDVIKHKYRAHGVPYECVCEICGKGFPDIGHLRSHNVRCFAEEKAKLTHEPLPCNLCKYI